MSDAPDYAELVKRLDTKWMNGPITRDWDSWRGYIAKGGGASWPRDAFEGYIETRDEEAEEAARAIETLVRERDEANRKASIALKAVRIWQGEAQQNFHLGREAGIREVLAVVQNLVNDEFLENAILALLDKPAKTGE